jgi:hypothetical protein
LKETIQQADTAQRRRRRTIGELLEQVEAEYREMPGLKLTEAQAQRLWNLDRRTCTTILTRLVEGRFLTRTRTGAYVRSRDLTNGRSDSGDNSARGPK